jgi:hypothetical protein
MLLDLTFQWLTHSTPCAYLFLTNFTSLTNNYNLLVPFLWWCRGLACTHGGHRAQHIQTSDKEILL